MSLIPPFWTEERVIELKALRMSGKSSSQIGELMAISRNAVIGKLYRLGQHDEALRRVSVRIKAAEYVRRPVVRKQQNGGNSMRAMSLLRRLNAQYEEPQFPSDHATRPTLLLDLKEHQCRWPCWHEDAEEKFFCGGEAVKFTPYCARHCLVAYQE